MKSTDLIKELYSLIETRRSQYEELKTALWKNPELGYQEVFAVSKQIKLLESYGFRIQKGYCGLETAYRAEILNGGPVFAFVAEYDALPELGHGCGHNLICTAAIAAAFAASSWLRANHFPGSIVVLGTPAEESGGGKVKMLKKNCLRDIDATMMVHPSWRTVPDTSSSAIRRFDVEFYGQAAHAAAAPELGRNALDSVILLFNGLNAWREHLPETSRLHGIILNGGSRPNIVPDYAKCRIYLRSTDEIWMEQMETRFRKMVQGAALMAGTEFKISGFNEPYKSRLPNTGMNNLFIAAAEKIGLNPVIPRRSGRGSSDYGNFSRTRPGIHPYFAISDTEIPGHSAEFATAANSALGFENTLKVAAAMAYVGCQFIADESFRTLVINEFKDKHIS